MNEGEALDQICLANIDKLKIPTSILVQRIQRIQRIPIEKGHARAMEQFFIYEKKGGRQK